jgi:lipocalin
MINFEDIIVDFHKVKSVNLVIFMNTFNYLLMEYGSPILFFISASGSAVYIWLKIKREFFNKK